MEENQALQKVLAVQRTDPPMLEEGQQQNLAEHGHLTALMRPSVNVHYENPSQELRINRIGRIFKNLRMHIAHKRNASLSAEAL